MFATMCFMKLIIRSTLSFVLSSTVIFSSVSADVDDIATLQARALEDSVALDIAEGITTELGPRMAGTADEAKARDWAVGKLTSLGFSNVNVETFSMPVWVRGKETASVTQPYQQPLAITALGRSASTGEAGIEAELAFFPTLATLKAAEPGSLDGKIAFISHTMQRTQDGSGYGAYGPVRWLGPSLAAERGALGAVIRSIGTDSHRNPHTGGTGFETGVNAIPAAAMSNPDADNLERIIARGKSVKIKMTLTPKNLGDRESGNVIAEVQGSDPDAGIVLIACHLDSWDLGTGAIDDASGCGIITAAAKLVMQAGKPKKTIRLLWAGAEEVGVYGGKAYAAAHKEDPHVLVMESDFGADRVWQVRFRAPEGAAETAKTKAVQAQIAQALLPLGIGQGSTEAGGGADVREIAKDKSVAVIDLRQDGSRYFDLHHTSDDTFDKIDPEQLRQNVAAWATVLSIVAND